MNNHEKKLIVAMIIQNYSAGDIDALYDEGAMEELKTVEKEILAVATKNNDIINSFDLHGFLLKNFNQIIKE